MAGKLAVRPGRLVDLVSRHDELGSRRSARSSGHFMMATDAQAASSNSAAPVVIVGAGPVGMTLALDLGSRGVPTIVVEQSMHTTTNPRCNTTNARSMEFYRRLRLSDRIRRTGLPVDQPTDMVYTTSLSGWELTRFEFSSAQEVLDGTAHEFAEWPTPELQHRISQIYLEPILDQEMQRYASVRVLRGFAVETVLQNASGAQVTARNVSTGDVLDLDADYVVACDGGQSVVRRALGVPLTGDSQVGERRLSIYFRSDSVELPQGRPGWRYLWRGERYHGAIIQLDGKSLYLCHARVPEHEELADADTEVAMREAIGYDVSHEELDVVRWIPRRLVADRFRVGRVVLAGDAAHVWLPDGGFGMNTGIGDAIGLGWRLAAIHAGWGTETLLDDYTFERRSVGEATSGAAKAIGQEMLRLTALTADPRLREDSADGAEIRAQAGELIQQVDRKQWYSKGVQFGSRYVNSPGLIDGGHGDHDSGAIGSIDEYEPSIAPGSRLPHYWTDGRAECVFDLLGQGMSLLVVGDIDFGAPEFEDAAQCSGVPVTVIRLPDDAREAYELPLVLVRPDWYVAWSGPQAPEDWSALFATLSGQNRSGTSPEPAFGESLPPKPRVVGRVGQR